MRERGQGDHAQRNKNQREQVAPLQSSQMEGLKHGPKTCISNQESILGLGSDLDGS